MKTRTWLKITAQAGSLELRVHSNTSSKKTLFVVKDWEFFTVELSPGYDSDSVVDALANLKKLSRDAELCKLLLDTEKD